MKNLIRKLLSLVCLLAFVTGIGIGCASRPPGPPPPRPKRIVKPPRPHAKATWVKGHWKWKKGRWVWVGGHWRR